MRSLRSFIIGAAIVGGASIASVVPAQADPDVGFYIGPDGARIYYDEDDYDRRYRRCYTDVWYTWRYGERVRVVDEICRDRFGRRRVVDRDYYPAYRWRW